MEPTITHQIEVLHNKQMQTNLAGARPLMRALGGHHAFLDNQLKREDYNRDY